MNKFLIFSMLFLLGCTTTQTAELPRDLEIRINSGEDATQSPVIGLLLFARYADECRYAVDGSWGPWESYSENKTLDVGSADGMKNIMYQCRNEKGESLIVSSSIILDSSPPNIILDAPVDGETYNSPLLLVFSVEDGSNTVECNATVGGSSLELGALTAGRLQNISISLAPGDHHLSIECRDRVQSSIEGVSFTIVNKPALKLVINNGSGYTQNSSVALDVISDGSECSFSNDNLHFSEWLSYSSQYAWQLRAGDGVRNVYARCRNEAGTISTIERDSIIVDSKPPPYISVSINNGASWTDSRSVDLGLYSYSASECRFSNGGDWTSYEPYVSKKQWMLSEGEGEKTVYYNCRNKNGTDIGIASSGIVFSNVPDVVPTGLKISINGGDSYTNSAAIVLDLSATGAYECRFRENQLNWSAWENYSKSKMLSLQGSDGAKTVYLQCRNDHGASTVFDRIYLDRVAPSKISNLKSSSNDYATVLSWSASTDQGSGIQHYFIFRRESGLPWTWVGSTSSLGFKDEKILPSTEYEYRVVAIDYSGNEGEPSIVKS